MFEYQHVRLHLEIDEFSGFQDFFLYFQGSLSGLNTAPYCDRLKTEDKFPLCILFVCIFTMTTH